MTSFLPEMYNPEPVCAVCGKPDPDLSFREMPASRVRRVVGLAFGLFPRTAVCGGDCLRAALKDRLGERIALRIPDVDVNP